MTLNCGICRREILEGEEFLAQEVSMAVYDSDAGDILPIDQLSRHICCIDCADKYRLLDKRTEERIERRLTS